MKVFFDIDGTLNVWENGAPLSKVKSPGYFEAREPHKNMVDAARMLHNMGADIYIVSAVFGDLPGAVNEKNRWINKYLPFVPTDHRLFPVCGKGKTDTIEEVGYASGDVFVDDYNVNLREVRIGTKNKIKCVKCVVEGTNDVRRTWDGHRVFVQDRPERIAMEIIGR